MLTGDELLELSGIDVNRVEDLRSVPSWDLDIDDMFTLASRVCTAIDEGYRSIVVTHGTDSMEESAWLTDLLLGPLRREACSVIFTGAMRFSDDSSADGPANLKFAMQWALDDKSVGQGVQIAFASQLHAARWVRKVDALELNAFSSDGRPSFSGRLPSTSGRIDKQVTMIVVNSIVRPEMPESMHGLVLRGPGAGHIPSIYFDFVDRMWSADVPVVIASRARDVKREVASGDRVLWAGDLTSEKAVLALMVGLGVSSKMSDITKWWSELLESSVR